MCLELRSDDKDEASDTKPKQHKFRMADRAYLLVHLELRAMTENHQFCDDSWLYLFEIGLTLEVSLDIQAYAKVPTLTP